MNLNKPNLFNFATSELSQDAFICWYLAWSDPQYRETDPLLHESSTCFIKEIFSKHQKYLPTEITSIKIERQVEGLDILAVVNKEYAILIEDKTFTANHSNQLQRYLEVVKRRGYQELLPIYYKIGNQSSYSTVTEASYAVFDRSDILKGLNEGIDQGIDNDVFIDYLSHLSNLEDAYNSYRISEIDEWKWRAWEGFYTGLQKEIDGHWGFIANQRGGFLGFWVKGEQQHDVGIYLQLEQEIVNEKRVGKLCIKICVPKVEMRSELRNNWSKQVIKDGSGYGLKLLKPKRFGTGKHMTLAVLEGEYRQVDSEKTIDMEQTLERVRGSISLLEHIKTELNGTVSV